MKFHNYWQLGGFLGIVFILMYYILFNAILYPAFSHQAELLSAPFTLPFMYGMSFGISTLYFSEAYSAFIGFVSVLVFYFLVGAFIGWFTGYFNFIRGK